MNQRLSIKCEICYKELEPGTFPDTEVGNPKLCPKCSYNKAMGAECINTIGWICPVCGAGLAPSIKECPKQHGKYNPGIGGAFG